MSKLSDLITPEVKAIAERVLHENTDWEDAILPACQEWWGNHDEVDGLEAAQALRMLAEAIYVRAWLKGRSSV